MGIKLLNSSIRIQYAVFIKSYCRIEFVICYGPHNQIKIVMNLTSAITDNKIWQLLQFFDIYCTTGLYGKVKAHQDFIKAGFT